jgi:lipoate---protein ligase
MYHLRLTLDTPAANVALDEQLLAAAETGELLGETLRLWESPQPVVVLGRSSPEREVHVEPCRADGVSIVRRVSGGATVVLGPGCLMYALVLDRSHRADLRGVDCAHAHVLNRLTTALGSLVPGVERAGSSDLALATKDGTPSRKFSGNSLRVKKSHVLYHGTILYDFPLERLERWLATPARQPDYRERRAHGDFVTNFPASRAAIEEKLLEVWEAREELSWPLTG